MIQPVFPSHLSQTETQILLQELSDKLVPNEKLYICRSSRAVRNVNDGSLMDPYLEESWCQASEAMAVELEGDYVASNAESIVRAQLPCKAHCVKVYLIQLTEFQEMLVEEKQHQQSLPM